MRVNCLDVIYLNDFFQLVFVFYVIDAVFYVFAYLDHQVFAFTTFWFCY